MKYNLLFVQCEGAGRSGHQEHDREDRGIRPSRADKKQPTNGEWRTMKKLWATVALFGAMQFCGPGQTEYHRPRPPIR